MTEMDYVFEVDDLFEEPMVVEMAPEIEKAIDVQVVTVDVHQPMKVETPPSPPSTGKHIIYKIYKCFGIDV